MKSLSRVQLFATPWTVAYQAPQSVGFSRQEYWNEFPFLHAKMGSIKDRNGIDLTEAEDIKEEVARIHRTVQKRSSQPR